jgi:hypothetical protein
MCLQGVSTDLLRCPTHRIAHVKLRCRGWPRVGKRHKEPAIGWMRREKNMEQLPAKPGPQSVFGREQHRLRRDRHLPANMPAPFGGRPGVDVVKATGAGSRACRRESTYSTRDNTRRCKVECHERRTHRYMQFSSTCSWYLGQCQLLEVVQVARLGAGEPETLRPS